MSKIATKSRKPKTPKADFRVVNCGTVWQFAFLSDACRRYVKDNVGTEDWQWMGNRLCVDHRPARDFKEFLLSEGFTAA